MPRLALEADAASLLKQGRAVVLLPHVGSASVHTRDMMCQRVVDNLFAWLDGKPPISPVAETPGPYPR